MKNLIICAMLVSILSAASWESFIKMPIEEKMLLQYEGLTRVANGTMENPYMGKSDAKKAMQWFSEAISTYSTYDASGYARAVANVKEYMKNMTFNITASGPAKMIKVGDHKYVSESICKAYPKECEQAAPAVKEPVVQNKRTPEQCLSARQKDWDDFCQSSYYQNPQQAIACDGVSEANKNWLLDNKANEYNSNQGKCLRGE